jgi:putative SOS response-associated peptidase YedK
MCGRYTLTEKDVGTIAGDLGAVFDDELVESHRPRYNVAPTQPAIIARLEDGGPPHLRLAAWGFHKERLLINARSETARERGAFREAVARRRCVVPADGFLEWQGEKKQRRPLWFHPPDGGLVWLAGLWETAPSGILSFVVLTCAPNDVVAPVHDRMPVVLRADDARRWLVRPDVDLLVPAANDLLVATPVSPRVNDAANDDPACLAEVADAPAEVAAPRGQLKLL